MAMLERTRRYAEKQPGFQILLETVNATLDHFKLEGADRDVVAEVLLQMRFDPHIVFETIDDKMRMLAEIRDHFLQSLPNPLPLTYQIFVYGTLKRGFALHRHLDRQKFIAEARTMPRYRMFVYRNGWFPLLVQEMDGGLSIEGELWEVNDECLRLLDRVEGHLFQRAFIELGPPHKDQLVEAYLYRYTPDEQCIDIGSCFQSPEDNNVLWESGTLDEADPPPALTEDEANQATGE